MKRQRSYRVAKVFVYGCLGERPFRAEEADLERFLLCQARRHDLAEQAQHFFVPQRPLVTLEDLAQDLGLAFRAVVVDRRRQLALGHTDLLRKTCPFVDQRLYLLVDLIDAATNLPQVIGTLFVFLTCCHKAIRLQACRDFAMPVHLQLRATCSWSPRSPRHSRRPWCTRAHRSTC